MTFRFAWRNFIVPLVLFALVFVSANAIVNTLCPNIIAFDCPVTFPISIFAMNPIGTTEWIFGLGVLALLPISAYFLDKWRYPVYAVVPLGVALILATNALAGWLTGFVVPIAYGDQLYYYQAREIENPLDFIRSYEENQPELRKHARTNPPGATLNIYFLNRLLVGEVDLDNDADLNRIGYISIFNVLVCGSLTGFFIGGIMRRLFPAEEWLAGYMALLFMLVPAIQIYYTNGTDPIISTSLIGVLYFLHHPRLSISILGGIACLFMASFTKFLFVFILPILLGYVVFQRHYWKQVLGILTGVVLIYLAFYLLLDFNYLNSFRIAAYVENYVEQSAGLNTYSDMTNYIATRIEGIGEIILFLTPFILLHSVRGASIGLKERSPLIMLSGLALCSVLGMFALGIWRTAETARLAMFIYPYLVLPTAFRLLKIEKTPSTRAYRLALLTAVFAQTVLMQLIGIYFA